MSKSARIVTTAQDLEEGLFGQVFLFIFEILPYLNRRRARPDWKIHAQRYGGEVTPVIPGVLDLAYKPKTGSRDVLLSLIRDRHCSELGNDWKALNLMWTSFFRVPAAVECQADAVDVSSDTLGVHYRGTDKQTADWDTNPVTAQDMIAIVNDFRSRRPDLTKIFLATDDNTFAKQLRNVAGCEIVNLGEVAFHKDEEAISQNLKSATRALLDSVLLSRCGAVIKTSSALSGFAKILNPHLEIYRCAASKQFADIPYFPVAYIPRYQSADPAIRAILDRLMHDDWQQSPALPMAVFSDRPRSRRRAIKWKIVEALTVPIVP